jgi:superfamily II DNA/RNA helicase
MEFPFSLSLFQTQSIEAVKRGENVLVTAHTGSGKSVPFEFAVSWFSQKQEKNKLIYCSPIKALSNQKYYELTKKFPDLRIGILTGDIKVNTDANILIMTTEILHNMLFATSTIPSFSIDVEKDLGCVVFDELHYINDADRGHIWENTIMKLPESVQLIMLSATLADPLSFAEWIMLNKPTRPICIAGSEERAVPLVHYNFLTSTQQLFKILKKDEVLVKKIKDQIDHFSPFCEGKAGFNEFGYNKMNSVLSLFKQHDVRINRQHVLNTVTKILVEKEMFPAICFILSRKQLVLAAKEVTTVLLEDDSKVPYIARRECETLIRKLPNFEEYLSLPEYNEVVSLLEKGIGIHHAGMMPVLREMVELFLSRGFIKLLFATETFALGVNFPIRTVLFTDITKFDGSQNRVFHSHEYTQMAGRAGRRGLDKVGHVIHLNNLFRPVTLIDYKKMIGGKSQTLVSKFKISKSLLLGLINCNNFNFVEFCKKSMIQKDIESDIYGYNIQLKKLQSEFVLRTPIDILKQYISLLEIKNTSGNKKKREAEKQLSKIIEEYPHVLSEITRLKTELEILKIKQDIEYAETFIETTIDRHLKELTETGYTLEEPTTHTIALTARGKNAIQFKEVDGILFSLLFDSMLIHKTEIIDLLKFLSVFTSIVVAEDCKIHKYSKGPLFEFLNKYPETDDMEIQYDIIEYVEEWCKCSSQEECKFLLQKMEREKSIYLGEFVKAMLKLCNICMELEKVCELTNDIELLQSLKTVPLLIMKFVVTNQSLYV